jgi:hypothetical protein
MSTMLRFTGGADKNNAKKLNYSLVWSLFEPDIFRLRSRQDKYGNINVGGGDSFHKGEQD